MTALKTSTDSLRTALPSKESAPEKKEPDFIGGLRRLEKDTLYNSQPEGTKTVIRAHLYDKYGEAYFKSKGINPDDTFRRKWINHESWTHPDGKGGTVGGIGEINKDGFSMLEVMSRFDASLKKGTDKFAQDVYETERSLVRKVINHDVPGSTGDKFVKYFDKEIDTRVNYFKGREAEADKWLGDHYNDSLKANIIELPGKAIGYGKDLVAMTAASRIVGSLNTGILGGVGLTEQAAAQSNKAKYAYNAIKEAAIGYLYGTAVGESGAKDAAIFASVGSGTKLGWDAIKYLSKIGVSGGTNVLARSIEAVKKLGPEEIRAASPEKVSNLNIKATAKMLNEVSTKLGYDNFWEAQRRGGSQKVMDAVAEGLHAGGEQAAIHNKEVVAKEAEHSFKEMSLNPLGSGLLDIAKQHGVDPIKETVEHVTKATEAVSGVSTSHKEYQAVGAASTHSFEFEENVSRAIKTDFKFESREHKLLAAYARLQNGQGKDLGFKFRDYKGKYLKQSDFFVHLLDTIRTDPKYAKFSMRELGEIGNRILDHMRAVEKQGGEKRMWRQAEFRPGKPRYSHQMELYKNLGMDSDPFVPESKGFGVSREK